MTMGRSKTTKPVPSKSKLKKDLGVPRLPDLKVKKAKQQNARPFIGAGQSTDPDAIMASEPTLSTLAQQAAAEAESLQFSDSSPSSSGTVQTKTIEQARKHYLRTLHKVIEESDIVILVLDARDPQGCRSRLVEEEVRRRESEGKKLVFVLNKIDLIPKANAQAWLKHLRHSTPTLPFLSPSSAQHQRTNISSSTTPALLKLLKAYKPKTGSVTIGVVGYPNTGKSSLINSLKRSKVCAVAAQPGHTKDLQSVQLERGVKIVDSPGVVFDEDDSQEKKNSVLLRNVVKVEDVDDPIAVVEEILGRTSREAIQKIYSLPEYTNTLEFLTMLALSSGRLLKGGTPDITGAARHVLNDWNHQKIPYFSEPPVIHPSMLPSETLGAEAVGQAQILPTLSAPFQLEGLFDAADNGAFNVGPDVQMEEEGDDDTENLMNEDMPGETGSRRISLKRPHSPSPEPISTSALPFVDSAVPEPSSASERQPKRFRKNKTSVDNEGSRRLAAGNPLNRRNLKNDRKAERKALNRKLKATRTDDSMEVDQALEETFMTAVDVL